MFRSRLQEIMSVRGVNVAALAAKLNPPRLSGQVYQWVNGAIPSTANLVDLAAALDVSTDDLLAPVGAPIYGRRHSEAAPVE